MRKYEIMYIVNASLDDDMRATEATNIEMLINVNGGTIVKTDDWGIRTFAYPIDHMIKGHYVIVDFDGNNETVSELHRLTNINKNIVRFMITQKN
ncbi:MAG: 30S ribosomal protein S6 [Erysipelothrix sp.]|nr:30S ribosomal protein S6 [Erysipelothrix sp.]